MLPWMLGRDKSKKNGLLLCSEIWDWVGKWTFLRLRQWQKVNIVLALVPQQKVRLFLLAQRESFTYGLSFKNSLLLSFEGITIRVSWLEPGDVFVLFFFPLALLTSGQPANLIGSSFKFPPLLIIFFTVSWWHDTSSSRLTFHHRSHPGETRARLFQSRYSRS